MSRIKEGEFFFPPPYQFPFLALVVAPYFFVHYYSLDFQVRVSTLVRSRFTNHLWTRIAIEQYITNFEYLKTSLCNVLDPLYFADVTLSFLICFWQLLMCEMLQEERFKFCLAIENNGALPLDPARPDRLSVWSTIYPKGVGVSNKNIFFLVHSCVVLFLVLLLKP